MDLLDKEKIVFDTLTEPDTGEIMKGFVIKKFEEGDTEMAKAYLADEKDRIGRDLSETKDKIRKLAGELEIIKEQNSNDYETYQVYSDVISTLLNKLREKGIDLEEYDPEKCDPEEYGIRMVLSANKGFQHSTKYGKKVNEYQSSLARQKWCEDEIEKLQKIEGQIK